MSLVHPVSICAIPHARTLPDAHSPEWAMRQQRKWAGFREVAVVSVEAFR